jgi:hypothetical protein
MTNDTKGGQLHDAGDSPPFSSVRTGGNEDEEGSNFVALGPRILRAVMDASMLKYASNESLERCDRRLEWMASIVHKNESASDPAHKGRPVMKRCIMSVLAVLLPSIATWGQTTPQAVFVGTTISVSQQILHIKGVPVQVHDYTIALYQMNTPPPGTDLAINFAVQDEAPVTLLGDHTNTWYCDQWFQRVSTLEKTANAQGTSYPYLEINVATGTHWVSTDEGVQIYPPGSVSCWEARGWFGPVSSSQ